MTPSHVVTSQAQTPSPAPKIVLHKPKEAGSSLAPAIAIPGASFAPPTGPAPGAARPAARAAAAAVRVCQGARCRNWRRPARQRAGLRQRRGAPPVGRRAGARAAQQFGEGARESPQMSAIDASKRQVLDQEAAGAAAAQKYRNSTPAGSEARPVQGQPRLGHSPDEQ